MLLSSVLTWLYRPATAAGARLIRAARTWWPSYALTFLILFDIDGLWELILLILDLDDILRLELLDVTDEPFFDQTAAFPGALRHEGASVAIEENAPIIVEWALV